MADRESARCRTLGTGCQGVKANAVPSRREPDVPPVERIQPTGVFFLLRLIFGEAVQIVLGGFGGASCIFDSLIAIAFCIAFL